MIVIGITGPSGAGKSSLSELFIKANIPVSDADSVYHELLDSSEELRSALANEFGKDILCDGKIERKILSSVVFSPGAEDKLKRLNEITHAFVISDIRKFLSECELSDEKFAVIDVPLLFESGLDSDCDYTVSVLADKDIRLERIISRDSIEEEDAKKRLDSQKPDSFYTERSSRIIYNNGRKGEIELEFMKLCARLGITLGGSK